MKVKPIIDNPNIKAISCFSNCLSQQKYAVTDANLPTVYLFNYNNEKLLELEHSGKLRTCSFSCDGTYVASGSQDCSIKIWYIDEEKAYEKQFIRLEETQRFIIRSLAFSPDNKMIACSIYDPNILIFWVETGTIKFKFGDFSSQCIYFNGSPFIVTGESLLICGGDNGNNKGYVWKWSSLLEENSNNCVLLIGHSLGIRSIAVKNSKIITGSFDASVRIWDEHGNSLNVMYDHSQSVLYILISNLDHNVFFTGSQDTSIIKWKSISESCTRVVTFDKLDSSIRGIFQVDNELIYGITANGNFNIISLDLSKYSESLFKLFYVFELLYILGAANDLILVYNIFIDGRYGLAGLYTIAILLPNIAFFFMHYTKYYKNSKDFIFQSSIIFLWVKVPWELLNNWKFPTYISENRVNMRSLRYLKLIDTIFRSIPTLIISVYYFMISTSIKYFKLIQIILSSFSIIKSLSWSFNDLDYDIINKIYLVIYRSFELGTNIGLLALFCTVVHPAYIFIVLSFSSFLHYALFTPHKSDVKKHWTEIILRNVQIISNSFAFTFCEETYVERDKETGQLMSKFSYSIIFGKISISRIVKDPKKIVCPNASIAHLVFQEITNFFINITLSTIISVINPRLKYCCIGLIILSIIKWAIPFIMKKRLVRNQ